jgi:pyruvate kinase
MNMSMQDFRLTKIIATLGPASNTAEVVSQLIENGVRVFRINFSHGSFEDYDQLIEIIRNAEKESGVHVAILGDLSGPKIRVGKVIEGGVDMEEGDEYEFIKKDILAGSPGYEKVFSSTFPSFIDEVMVGEKVLLDDGNVELKVSYKSDKGQDSSIRCRVVNGGLITSSKGINLPETELSVDALTDKDIRCVHYAVDKKMDYLALSFVRKGEDLIKLKELLVQLGARPKDIGAVPRSTSSVFPPVSTRNLIPVICKIEKPQAIQNLNEILRETDGVMVARGDLGVEMDLAEVALLQKRIVHLCKEYGRPVIVATQMLQSMIESPVPTRAEVSDIANAIFDGADAVMLSGETAMGKYPVKAAAMMNDVANRTNAFIKDQTIKIGSAILKPEHSMRTLAIAEGVKKIAEQVNPKFIVVWTNWGGSAIYLSQLRLPIPILAFTSGKKRLRLLTLLFGVKPVYLEQPESGSTFIRAIDKLLLRQKWAQKNDPIIVVSGDPITRTGLANRIVVHYVGEGVEQ